jgi:flavin reductase (DIM6/NTAB) family NADH-FMN oxidoreductase RutF
MNTTTLTSPTAAASFSSAEFKQCLGMFATGVTVITTRSTDDRLIGFTANSFNSVSLSPPLVLWSLSCHSSALTPFLHCKHYAINILAADQKDLALQFSAKIPDRFAGVDYSLNDHGVPLLAGAVAQFECSNRSRYHEGDHMIFVGEVHRCSHQNGASPLLYHGGQFYTEHPL